MQQDLAEQMPARMTYLHRRLTGSPHRGVDARSVVDPHPGGVTALSSSPDPTFYRKLIPDASNLNFTQFNERQR